MSMSWRVAEARGRGCAAVELAELSRPTHNFSTFTSRLAAGGLRCYTLRAVARFPRQDAAGWAEWRGAVHSGPMVDVSNFVVLYDEAVATAGDGDDDGGGGGGGGGGRQAQHPPAIRKGGAAAEEDDDGDDEIPSSLLGR